MPSVKNRFDPEAEAMMEPVDPHTAGSSFLPFCRCLLLYSDYLAEMLCLKWKRFSGS